MSGTTEDIIELEQTLARYAVGMTKGWHALAGGASATQGSLTSKLKKTAPVSLTVRNTSDSASAAIGLSQNQGRASMLPGRLSKP